MDDAPIPAASTEEGQPASKQKRVQAREPGKSLFPVARVQRILKADKARPRICPRSHMLTPL